jgi:uncharacterized protein YodC (DUF2158 family)
MFRPLHLTEVLGEAHDMPTQFQPGEVVQLKSGGPKMTIQKKESDGWQCIWFDKEGKQQYQTFPEEVLGPPKRITVDFVDL